MREFQRIRQLDLALSAQPHKGLPDAVWCTLLCRLRQEVPGPTGIGRPADCDTEVRGAVGPNVMVAECPQHSARCDLQKKHVVDVALAAAYFSPVLEGPTAVRTSRYGEHACLALEVGERGE